MNGDVEMNDYSGKAPPAPGSASTPTEGLSTNVSTGEELGEWPIRGTAMVYRGHGHMALAGWIAEADTADGHHLDWSHDLGWTRIKCGLKDPSGERVATVELDCRELLEQLGQVGFRALAGEAPVTVGQSSYLTDKQNVLLAALIQAGWLEYLNAENPWGELDHERHSYVITRTGSGSEQLSVSTADFVLVIAALTCELAMEACDA